LEPQVHALVNAQQDGLELIVALQLLV